MVSNLPSAAQKPLPLGVVLKGSGCVYSLWQYTWVFRSSRNRVAFSRDRTVCFDIFISQFRQW